jgi:hypothetical protein
MVREGGLRKPRAKRPFESAISSRLGLHAARTRTIAPAFGLQSASASASAVTGALRPMAMSPRERLRIIAVDRVRSRGAGLLPEAPSACLAGCDMPTRTDCAPPMGVVERANVLSKRAGDGRTGHPIGDRGARLYRGTPSSGEVRIGSALRLAAVMPYASMLDAIPLTPECSSPLW